MIIRLDEADSHENFVLIELQGELECPEEVKPQHMIGTLHQSDKGEYQLEISNRIRLTGKKTKLAKPLLIIREDASGVSLLSDANTGKRRIMLTEKILFSSRPMAILEDHPPTNSK